MPLGETIIRQWFYFTACEHSLTAQPLGAFQTVIVSGPNLKFSFKGGLLQLLIPQIPLRGSSLHGEGGWGGGAGAWGWTGQGWQTPRWASLLPQLCDDRTKHWRYGATAAKIQAACWPWGAVGTVASCPAVPMLMAKEGRKGGAAEQQCPFCQGGFFLNYVLCGYPFWLPSLSEAEVQKMLESRTSEQHSRRTKTVCLCWSTDFHRTKRHTHTCSSQTKGTNIPKGFCNYFRASVI